ncbi:hypothetical protein LI951_14820 [Enterococcus sp. BWT-B8]|uniref:hypothetical protein n=1 Tax=Enterococcus sp. BWT-B8 TaxID=2885157 RepID=UPI001E3A1898|nr:hypothetical protein [Enterococcus sp. BWT-B8]MCB5953340.1 hypothetical protein [Enterococcus sp. BWT-B8]
MCKEDKKVIWKDQNDLILMMIINNFIEKNDVKSVRQYQQKIKEFPKEVPSVWFIVERYGSWEKLMLRIGIITNNQKSWKKMTNEELYMSAEQFIVSNNIKSQRSYEKISVGKNVPSLSTLKKRIGDVKPLFKKKMNTEIHQTNFELLLELKNEIVRLGMEGNPSITEFRKRNCSTKLPSVDTLKRHFGKTWEELMEEIGFDYRAVKIRKMSENFSRDD